MAAHRRGFGFHALRAGGLLAVAAMSVTTLPGCGAAVSHILDARRGAASPSTTAVLQAVGPIALTVTPANGPAGTPFHVHASGLAPTDAITFAVAAQGGHPYVGPRHTPARDGTVVAVYETAPSDRVGLYVVLGHTASGRTLYATFHVDPPATGPPS